MARWKIEVKADSPTQAAQEAMQGDCHWTPIIPGALNDSLHEAL